MLEPVSTGMKAASASEARRQVPKPSALVKVPTLIAQEIGRREHATDDRAGPVSDETA